MNFSDKTYDLLKWIAQIFIPAIAAAYLALANVWSLPYANEVVATLTIVDLFLGSVLGLSTAMYNKMVSDNNAIKLFINRLSDTEIDRVKTYISEAEKAGVAPTKSKV